MRTVYHWGLRRFLTVVSTFVISCAAVTAQAAPGGGGSGGGKMSCSINDPGAITVGVETSFSATVTSNKAYTSQWTFSNATPDMSTDMEPTTTFNALGDQTVTLVVTQESNAKKPKTTSCSLQVSVAAVGGDPTRTR